jgi:hypothetical protein
MLFPSSTEPNSFLISDQLQKQNSWRCWTVGVEYGITNKGYRSKTVSVVSSAGLSFPLLIFPVASTLRTHKLWSNKFAFILTLN